ncbi:cytochrome c family protein [Marinicauda algicola]|uniref:Cytochrome c family protein n=1 Tax=Marinicauda algicola TaxID=2029849 RepID=A0A4S2H035_9PROT|nr:cytochrome c family protein [Marinicauda algicola]TGY88442.1 cytochrome c family protein [Marinicauda algicola]
MGDLFWNKVAGALLAIVLVVLGLRTFGEALFPHEELDPEELAYPIDLAALEGTTAPAEEEEEGPVDYGALLAAADVSAGERVANRCTSCHTFEQGGRNGTGPNLWNTVMNPVAAAEGFNYSAAMEEFAQGGTVWSYEHLDGFLANPRGYVPGTAMSFAGLRNEDDRMNLIAWMRTLSPDPAPLPEPLPEEAPAVEEAAAEGEAAPELGPEMVDAEVETDINAPAEAVAETAEIDEEDVLVEGGEDAADDEQVQTDDEPND